MTDERFWSRNFAALAPVILSVDHARSLRKRPSRRNLGWGQRPVSPIPIIWTIRTP